MNLLIFWLNKTIIDSNIQFKNAVDINKQLDTLDFNILDTQTPK
jgi:hypothetical protein